MSALDEYLESRKVDTRATGEIQDGYKVYETIHDGLYESALVELDTLRAQLAEAREANERLAWRMKWISDNPCDGIALRYAFKATDEEVDDIRSKEQVTTA